MNFLNNYLKMINTITNDFKTQFKLIEIDIEHLQKLYNYNSFKSEIEENIHKQNIERTRNRITTRINLTNKRIDKEFSNIDKRIKENMYLYHKQNLNKLLQKYKSIEKIRFSDKNNDEISKICNDIELFSEMVNDLKDIVIIHGEILDKINSNLDNCLEDVENGNENLISSNNLHKDLFSKRNIIIFFLLIIIIILFIVFAVNL